MKRLLLFAVGVFLFVLVSCRQSGNQAVDSGTSPQMGARPQLDERGLAPARTDVMVKVNSSRSVNALEYDSAIATGARTPEPGKIFLIVNVTVTSNADKAIDIVTEYFRLLASNQQVYSGNSAFDSFKGISPILATLLKGGKCSGVIIFEVDSGAKLGAIEMVQR